MSKVAIDAASRDFIIKPRLEYRTLQGVNGPLVILEVRSTVIHRAGGSAPPRPSVLQATMPAPSGRPGAYCVVTPASTSRLRCAMVVRSLAARTRVV